MRKALLAAAAACSMIVPSTGHAATNLSFTIMAPVSPAPSTAGVTARCVTEGFANTRACQKPTYTRLARCLFTEARGEAQDGRVGQIGYVFKIKTQRTNGGETSISASNPRNNATFSLSVTNALHKNNPGKVTVPDVDVVFYADLGVCASDVELPSDIFIPVAGDGPTPIEDSAYTFGSHTGLGDERADFPDGAYIPIGAVNPVMSTEYWAIVTIFGGTIPQDGAKINMTCTLNSGAECPAGWFATV